VSILRSWLRAHRSAIVQEVLRRGLFDAVAPPWFMFSSRSTSEAWLALEDWAVRDLERRRKAKEEAERPIREKAAHEAAVNIVKRARAFLDEVKTENRKIPIGQAFTGGPLAGASMWNVWEFSHRELVALVDLLEREFATQGGDVTALTLAPCPFCGSDKVVVCGPLKGGFWAVFCECQVEGPPSRVSAADAVTKWNTRPREGRAS
jgi:hypothetical protein